MRFRAVEAVWVWRYGVAPFKATYGRLPGTQYSKDFLQTSGDCAEVMDDVLERAPGTTLPLTFRWPGGGTRSGSLFAGTDHNPPDGRRLELRWETNNAPAPWKLYPDATSATLATFPGNPDHQTEADANAELQAFQQQDLDPWLVVVKLWGEPGTLHVRAYLGNPPPTLEHTNTENLPDQVLDAMATVPANGGCQVVRFEELPGVRAEGLVRSVLDSMQRGPNVLMTGPPGTGKTVAMEDLRALFANDDWVLFDPELLHDAWSTAEKRRSRSVVFHSSYSYEDLVLGLLPEPFAGGGVELVPHPGPLLELGHWTSTPSHVGLLSTDEFNRGNAAGIFGDMLALLDEEKRADPAVGREGAEVDRPYPGLLVEVPGQFEVAGSTLVANPLTLSSNLVTVAALNSSDRSVAPVDAALRRRFSIIDVGPDYQVLADHLGVPFTGAFNGPADPMHWTAENARDFAVHLLRSLNGRIELVLGRDFLLGHALLWTVRGSSPEEVVGSLAGAFDEQVAATLRMAFTEQDELLAAVLNAGPPPDAPQAPTPDAVASWVVPPPSLSAVALPRLRVASVQALAWPTNARALQGLL